MFAEIVDVLTFIRDRISPLTIENFYVNYRAAPSSEGRELGETRAKSPMVEFHRFYEIAIQIDQTSSLQIGNDLFHLLQNQFCIIPREVSHSLKKVSYSKKPAKILWVSATGEIVRTSYSIYSKNDQRKVYGADLYIPGSFFLGEICEERVMKRAGSAEAISSYLQAFFSLLIQKMSFDGELAGRVWMNSVVNELQHYIKERIHESLKLQDLSDHVSLSPNYLSKLFKQVTGETITTYTQSIKIARSIEYLSDPTISLSEIAERLGFYDQFHFSKVFKAYTCLSPSNYRKAFLKRGLTLTVHGDLSNEKSL